MALRRAAQVPLLRASRMAPRTMVRLMSDQSEKKDEKKDEPKKQAESKPSLFSRFNIFAKAKETPAAASAAASEPRGPVTAVVNLLSSLKKELMDDSAYFQKAEPYRPPADRRRSAVERPAAKIDANETATEVVMHENSKWESQWKNATENNPVLDKLFEMKMKYDESDNILIRGARSFTDKVSEGIGNVLEDDESQVALAEIYKLDPTFDKDNFALHCERKVCPAVLEAFIAGDLHTLKDWCAEPCYNVLEANIEGRKQQGLVFDSKILDLRNAEILMAKMMDEGPVLILSFQTQQVKCVRDRTGAIVEGGEDHIERCWYILAMRRNPNIFDPLHAWQVLEIGEQFTQETW